jgi:sulfatase modifying factor 1
MTTSVPLSLAPLRAARKAPHPDMVWIPGGEFRMGSDDHYVDEGPAHRVSVDGFWMDRCPVTNERFARFVEESAHITFAELAPKESDYPGARPGKLYAGSLVFEQPAGPVDLRVPTWWDFRRGANWRHPLGASSDIEDLQQHPVIHVAYSDALMFAEWEGKSLPTEAEWEFAARGGLDGAAFAWGNQFMPHGKRMANTWHGDFPRLKKMDDGWIRTSPVTAYPANGYGLHDMIGNVWEWTTDWYRPSHQVDGVKSGRIPKNPRVLRQNESYDGRSGRAPIPRKVLKGGSYLSAQNYCRRFRPAARHPEAIDTSACHIGFRCIVRPE